MGKPGDGANTANGRAEGAREPRVADGVRKPLLGGWPIVGENYCRTG